MSNNLESLSFEKNLDKYSRVLVINPLNTYWSYQLTAEASLRCREKTSNVSWLNVATKTPKQFEINPQDHYSSFSYSKVHKNMAHFLGENCIQVSPNLIKVKKVNHSRSFTNIVQFREFMFEDQPLGRMAFSAISSALKRTDFDLDEIETSIDFFLEHAIVSWKRVQKEIQEFDPTLVITINDRLIGSAIALKAAEKRDIKTSIIYWGKSPDHVADYESSLYSGDEWEKKVRQHWKLSIGRDQIEEIEESKEQIKALGLEPSDDSKTYLSTQVSGKKLNSVEPFCVFYAQSEYEHSAHLIVNSNERFSNQYEAFDTLQRVCKELNLKLYLKFHPVKVLNSDPNRLKLFNRVDWQSINISNEVGIIEEDSEVDTYELIHQAKFNVIWTSTVGLECLAREIAPIVLGFPLWLNRQWKIHAWNENQLLKSLSLSRGSFDKFELIPYFYYVKTFGSRCKYSNIHEVWDKQGRSISLNQPSFLDILERLNSALKRLLIIASKFVKR